MLRVVDDDFESSYKIVPDTKTEAVSLGNLLIG